MQGYLFWLVLLALAILSASIMQMQARAGHRLADDCRRLQSEIDRLRWRLREKETSLDGLDRRLAQLLRWQARAADLEGELKAAKQSQDYASAARLHFLEDSLSPSEGEPAAKFLATIPAASPAVSSLCGSSVRSIASSSAGKSLEQHLQVMMEQADFELVIVSPWIKKQTWNKMAGRLKRFTAKGGRLKVFTRGTSSDYSLGLADDLYEEISSLGGSVILVPRLHAKIYMADRRQAIITSANLTRGGTEGNFESGLLVSDPLVLKEICDFLDDMAAQSYESELN